MNIVLIGMRGSGKTTVGRILARKTGRQLVETDELIAQKAGLAIPDIAQKHGWKKFRDLEERVTGQVAKLDNIINASGGGVVTREQNIRELKRNGVVVWLTADLDTLLQRVGQDPQRPPLVEGRTRREDMELTLKEREALYRQAADFTVDTGNKTPEETARAILELLAVRGIP